MTEETQGSILTYLLHFDQDVRGKRHYIGSCKTSQLMERMRRHQLGTGASLTAQVHRQGVGFSIEALYQTADRSLETKLKNAGHYRNLCYKCRTGIDGAVLFPNVLYFPPVAQITPSTVYCW